MATKKEIKIAKSKAVDGGMPTDVADRVFSMQMGDREMDTPTTFSSRDQGVMAMSTMYQTDLEPGMQGYFRQEKNKGRDAASIRADLNTPSIKVPDSNYRTNYEVAETLFPGSVSDSNLLESMDTSAYNVSRGNTVGPLDRQPVRRDDGTVTYTYGDGVGTTKKKTTPKSKKREKVSAFDVPKSKGISVSTQPSAPKNLPSAPKTKKETTTAPKSQKTQALKAYERRQNIRGLKVSEREYRRQLRKTRRGKAMPGGLDAAKGNLRQAQEQLKQAQTVRFGEKFAMPMLVNKKMSFRKKNKK